jgi:hypothetical protein
MLLPSWHYGVTVVAHRARKFDAARAFDLMARHKVRNVFLPATVLKMMRLIENPRQQWDVHLRTIHTGGETVGEDVIRWARDALGATPHEAFGQTEAVMIIGNCTDYMPIKPGSLGQPIPGHEITLLDADGRPTPDRADSDFQIFRIERIAGRAHGADRIHLGIAIERTAQATDVHIDGASLDVDIRTPDRIEQLLAREDAAGVLHEVFEQAEFRRPEMDLFTRALHPVCGAVDRDVADHDLVFSQARTNTAQDGAQAGEELVHRERLGQVIVGALIEATDAIALVAAGRQHDDRRVARLAARAQPAADFDPRNLGQHPVEQDEIGADLVGEKQGLFAVARQRNAIAFLLEIVFEQKRQRFLVLDDQNVRNHRSSRPSEIRIR